MKTKTNAFNRRNFIKKTSMIAVGTITTHGLFAASSNTPLYNNISDNLNIVGPKEGFTPQIGTLVSMMNWMRNTMLRPVRGMSVSDLDYLHDKNANTIGAMLMHLAATERFYQIHTLEGKNWGDWSKKDADKWTIASGLGQKARRKIKGNNLNFYLDLLNEVREHTLSEFAKRDDDWLMEVDKDWAWGPTNNYCKWFHVCEHESNHNGQFKFIKKRIHS